MNAGNTTCTITRAMFANLLVFSVFHHAVDMLNDIPDTAGLIANAVIS